MADDSTAMPTDWTALTDDEVIDLNELADGRGPISDPAANEMQSRNLDY